MLKCTGTHDTHRTFTGAKAGQTQAQKGKAVTSTGAKEVHLQAQKKMYSHT